MLMAATCCYSFFLAYGSEAGEEPAELEPLFEPLFERFHRLLLGSVVLVASVASVVGGACVVGGGAVGAGGGGGRGVATGGRTPAGPGKSFGKSWISPSRAPGPISKRRDSWPIHARAFCQASAGQYVGLCSLFGVSLKIIGHHRSP